MSKKPEKTDWTKIDTKVDFEGKKIVLPKDPEKMDYENAIVTLQRIQDQENQEFEVSEHIPGAPWDTLVAVHMAMQQLYGVVMSESIQTFFGEIKPDFVTIQTGVGWRDKVQVSIGQMSLPGVSNPIHVSSNQTGTYIQGTVRKRDRARLVEISNIAKKIVRENSIYKAKAINLNVDSGGDLEFKKQPVFLDVSKIKEEDIIHTRETEALVHTNIFAPLKHTAACRRNKIPLKRGILLEGKYGTGKSLTARVTAKVATDNGWTFIMLNRSQGLRNAIEFARNYQPCVIFAEDIDRAADRSEESVNDLVNMLDGLLTKDMEMMVVLTTNHVENIDKSLLRPGRFDAVISIDVPDEETAIRIIKAYAGYLLEEDSDLTKVSEITAGMIPASIREVVERAKLSMLMESRKTITAKDLYIAAVGMQKHMDLLNDKKEEPHPGDMLAHALTALIGNALVSGDDVNASLAPLRAMQRVTSAAMISKLIDLMEVTKQTANVSAETRENTKKILRNI